MLDGKVILITGAASGIGAATARLAKAQGAHLVNHKDWQRVMDVQLTATFAMAKAVLPHMMF